MTCTMIRVAEGSSNAGGKMAIAMERCRHLMVDRFNRHGYRLFWPSGLQLLETCWLLPPSIRRQLIVLNSPAGEPCCLRPDITLAAVSYMASNYPLDQWPLRICYSDRVYRKAPKGSAIETFQIGAELLGWEGEGADLEMLHLLVKSLDDLGLTDTVLVLSDPSLVSRAMEGIDPDMREKMIRALQDRSYRSYMDLAKNVPGPHRKFLQALPELKGKGEALEEIKKLTGEGETEALERIQRSISSVMAKDRVFFDLASVRELDYYSGPIFDVYSSGSGTSLGGGGRYDGLLSRYGLSGQAVGFGLDLEELAKQSSYRNPEPIVAVWGGGTSVEKALNSCSILHDLGLTTEILWSSEKGQSQDRTRAKGYRWWFDPKDRLIVDVEKGMEMALDRWIEERNDLP